MNIFKKIMYYCLLMGACSYGSFAFSYDLGTMGETYPIMEDDFLELIRARALAAEQNGRWKVAQEQMQTQAEQYRDRPAVVEGIVRTAMTKSWTFDPSIVLDHNVITPDGKLLALAGTRINPLNYIPLTKALIFYDADDIDQVNWAIKKNKTLDGHAKLVLVKGSVLSQEKIFKKPIYFDQAGKLTSHFNIIHVPALVNQEEEMLRITEEKP